MTDLDEKGNALDLCPMCSGNGKHNLQPPDGLFIRSIDIEQVRDIIGSISIANYHGSDENTLANKKIRNEYIKCMCDAGFQSRLDYSVQQVKTAFLNYFVNLGYEIAFMTGNGNEFIFKWRWM